jgi:hypothetical protein
MSLAAPSPSGTAGSAGAAPPSAPEQPASEACPLCGAPLHPEQEWCLNCGAAARTRLAASPAWRGPIVTLVVVLILCLGVLAGSLVKLAGGSRAPTTQTTTVTTATATATSTVQNGLLPQTTVPPTATTRSSTQPRSGSTPTTTTPPTGITTVPAIKPKAKGPLGGINPNHLKQSIAEQLRKLGLTGK